MKKYCKTCGFVDPKQLVCRLTRLPIDIESDFCSKHQKEPYVCSVCGSTLLSPIITMQGDVPHILCGDCASQLNSCAFCKNANTCDFETNPSSLPKLVQKQIRQGNMITVATVKNPERIRETCEKGCKCFDAENGCQKQNRYCKELDHVFD